MSYFKKVVSCILIFSIVTAMGMSLAYAETQKADVKVNETDYEIAEKLELLGIIDAVEEEKLANYMTRRDMVKVLSTYLGYGKLSSESSRSPFYDVSAGDPLIGTYNALYKAGYISGDENKMFRPDDFLTYNEAITFVINAMGYRPLAVRNGGYPGGYLFIANKYSMLEGLRGNGNNPIPYCDLYKLIESSLKAYAFVQDYYTKDGEDENLVFSSTVTVLESLRGIVAFSGIVTGNENTRLFGYDSSRIDMHQIEIDNVIYDTPEHTYADYLGRKVYAYAKKVNGDSYEIIYMEPIYRANNEYKLSADVLLKDKTTTDRIYYENEDYKEKYLNVNSSGIPVIYNGKAHSFGHLKNAIPTNGYIVALDNSGDSIIDVLFVYEYKNYVVGAIDTTNGKIFDKYTNESVALDKDTDDVRIYNANGEQVKLEEISSGDIVSVMETKNTSGYKLKTVYIPDKSIEGTVTEVVGNYYKINGETYLLAENMKNYILASKTANITAGTSGTFYLDFGGDIAYVKRATSTSALYGFVAGVDYDSGLSRRVSVRIFTQDSAWVEAEVSNPVIIDGSRYTLSNDTEVFSVVSLIPIGEIVLFTTKDDKVNVIDTKALNYGNSSKIMDTGNLNEVLSGTTGEGFFYANGMAQKGGPEAVVIPSDTIVFNVPMAADLLTELDGYSITKGLSKKEYKAGSGGERQTVDDGFAIYNTEDKDINTASCILLKGSKGATGTVITLDAALCVITDITSAVNEEGEVKTKVHYFNNQGSKYAYIDDPSAIKYSQKLVYLYAEPTTTQSFASVGLMPGDVVNLAIDEKNNIKTINMVYRYDQEGSRKNDAWLNGEQYSLDPGARYSGSGAASGTAQTIDTENSVLRFSVTASGITNYYNVKSGTVMIYNSTKQKVEFGSLSSIQKGERVVVKANNGGYSRMAQIVVLR